MVFFAAAIMSRYSACTSQICGSLVEGGARSRERDRRVGERNGQIGWPGVGTRRRTVFFELQRMTGRTQPAVANDIVDDERRFTVHRHHGVVERRVVRVIAFIHATAVTGRVLAGVPAAAGRDQARRRTPSAPSMTMSF